MGCLCSKKDDVAHHHHESYMCHPLLRPSNASHEHHRRPSAKPNEMLDTINGPMILADPSPKAVEGRPSNNIRKRKFSTAELLRASLKTGITPKTVQLPVGVPEAFWLHVHISDFYQHISTFQSTILSSYCTPASCPRMSGGELVEFLWTEGDMPQKLSAAEYINEVQQFVKEKLDSTSSTIDNTSDETCPEITAEIRKTYMVIMKLIYHVYCHIFYEHYYIFVEKGATAHLNTCFKWFVYFNAEFALLNSNDLSPLKRIVDHILSAPTDENTGNPIHNCVMSEQEAYRPQSIKVSVDVFDQNDAFFDSEQASP